MTALPLLLTVNLAAMPPSCGSLADEPSGSIHLELCRGLDWIKKLTQMDHTFSRDSV